MATGSDNQMIKQVYVEHFARPLNFSRQGDIGAGRRWIARWVIVNSNDCRRVLPDSIAKNLGNSHLSLVHTSLIYRPDIEHPMLRVEQNDSQLFLLQHRHLDTY